MPDEVKTDKVTASNHDEKSIFNPDATHRKLEEMITHFHLPAWVTTKLDGTKRKCLVCDAELQPVTVRGISMCLNAQHIGDTQVEIMCSLCYASYFLHFRKACSNTSEFCNMLLVGAPKTEPVLMTKIGPTENNLADAIITDERKATTGELQCQL